MRRRRKFNLDDFQINSVNRRYRRSTNNSLFRWSWLIGLLFISYCGRNQANQWNAPTVKSNETGMSLSQLYSVEPNLQKCQEGILNNSEAEKVLDRLNYIRNLHHLNPVNYNYRNDTVTAKFALILAANADREETPNATFRCWSELGEIGRQDSLGYEIHYPHSSNIQTTPARNLYNSEKFVDALLMDSRREDVFASSVLLNPFLKSISFGRVDDKSLVNKAVGLGWDAEELERQVDYISGADIKFTYNEKPDIDNLKIDTVAYPLGEYPKELFKKDVYQRGYPTMFFSIVAAQRKLVERQDVDFSNAVVEIHGEDGTNLEITSMQSIKHQTRLPNALSWKANQTKVGVKYTVKIKNIILFNKMYTYDYWFKLK